MIAVTAIDKAAIALLSTIDSELAWLTALRADLVELGDRAELMLHISRDEPPPPASTAITPTPTVAADLDDNPAPPAGLLFACIDCGREFSRAAALGRHRSAAHLRKPEVVVAPPAPPAEPSLSSDGPKPRATAANEARTGVRILMCDECEFECGSDRAMDLNRHTLTVHGRRATVAERTPVLAGAARA